MKQTFYLVHAEARLRAVEAVYQAPEGAQVTIGDRTRNSEQNALMWVLLEAFSKQLEWPVNGAMCYLSADDWKNILSAAFRQENIRLAQGIDGNLVMLGSRTSQMGKKEFADFITFIESIAVEKGIQIDTLTEISESGPW